MTFEKPGDVWNRLSDPTLLSIDEIRAALAHVTTLGQPFLVRLQLDAAVRQIEAISNFEQVSRDLATQQIAAINRFDRSSTKISLAAVALAVVSALATAIGVWITYTGRAH